MNNSGNIVKAISIIDSLRLSKEGVSLQQISKITDISKTTTYRLCEMLVQNDILYKNSETKTYKLGPKFLEWIFAFKDHLDVFTEIKNILSIISKEIGETVTVFKKHHFERECIFRFEVNEMLKYSIKVGERLPLYKGAGGKVILAFFKKDELDSYLEELNINDTDKIKLLSQLEEIRKNKFYISYGERDPYIAAFSVPLFNIMKNNIIGSLSVSGPLERFKDRFKDKHIEFVKSKSLYIQTLMNMWGDVDE